MRNDLSSVENAVQVPPVPRKPVKRSIGKKSIQFYNEVRPHQTLDYKTPQAFEAAHEGNYI